jgi:hypothetical protein
MKFSTPQSHFPTDLKQNMNMNINIHDQSGLSHSHYGTKNMNFFRFNPTNINTNENDLINQDISLRIYKSLNLSNQYLKTLKSTEESDNDLEEMERELSQLGIYNIDKWIENFKYF